MIPSLSGRKLARYVPPSMREIDSVVKPATTSIL